MAGEVLTLQDLLHNMKYRQEVRGSRTQFLAWCETCAFVSPDPLQVFWDVIRSLVDLSLNLHG